MKTPVRWLGGKGRILTDILPLIPPHGVYVEPYGGSASLLFAKAPSAVEVYNDIDQGLVGFFRILRDETMTARLRHLLDLTPYSRVEWQICRDTWQSQEDPIERARRWFVVVWQSFGKFFGQAWGYIAHAGDLAAAFRRATDNLPDAARRFAHVQVECDDALAVIGRFDSPATFFYLDPPYLPETRVAEGTTNYAHEMSTGAHVALLDCLLQIQGMAVLSGYGHAQMGMLVQAGWAKLDIHSNIQSYRSDSRKIPRVECLWVSPRALPDTSGDILDLFGG